MAYKPKKAFFHELLFYIIFASLFLALLFIGHFLVPKDVKLLKHFIILVIILAICFILFLVAHITKIRLQTLLNYDDLTNLYSLKKFQSEAEEILSKANENEYSMISIDISKFRYITSSFGTKTADKIIEILGKQIQKVLPENAIACRNYVDNFSILINETLQPIIEDYVISMLSIVSSMGQLLPLHYTVDFSIGVYVISDTSEDVNSILQKANTAREFGRNSLNPKRISYYTSQMNTDSEKEKEILFDMNRAFEANEFIAYYQPKFRFSDKQIIGAEALVRWKHKDKGILSPGDFVPLFEKNGFIQKIDRQIFESVCKFLDAWNKSVTQGFKPYPITISCNLSRFQLYNPDIAKDYAKIASKYQIWPSKIEIELTESLMMDNKARLLRAMNEIRNAGFEISVDDFGSGFSSLSLLKDIPANVLKLDKEFLTNSMNKNEKKNIIVHSVINMAKELELVTVAEGVEEETQAELLREMGCDIAQGFLYAKPMCEEDFRNLLLSQT